MKERDCLVNFSLIDLTGLDLTKEGKWVTNVGMEKDGGIIQAPIDEFVKGVLDVYDGTEETLDYTLAAFQAMIDNAPLKAIVISSLLPVATAISVYALSKGVDVYDVFFDQDFKVIRINMYKSNNNPVLPKVKTDFDHLFDGNMKAQ